jgi:hypothetical protein
MAATIEIKGWLDGVKEFSWGIALRVSSPNSVKNAAGEWEITSRDYYDVVLADGVSLNGINEGDKVIVRGGFKTGKSYQKKDGSYGIELKVRARSIELDPEKRGEVGNVANLATIGATLVADDEMPF